MRMAGFFVLALGSFLLVAQEPSSGIKKVPPKQTPVDSGAKMYREYCASCHGLDGKGDGPVASTLVRRPTDLTLLSQKNGGKFPILLVKNSIQNGVTAGHGSKDMPVWGPILSSVSQHSQALVMLRVENLTHYIESLQAK
jgi:mono/diheme cytochrome c family protein